MTHQSKFVVLFSVFTFILLIVNYSLLIASVPPLIHYQARLMDDAGEPLVGSHTVTFNLYTEEAGGTPIWIEIHTVDLDSSGLYELMLGSITSFEDGSVDFSVPYWLAISVDGAAEMDRFQIGTSPYAIHAKYADSVAVDGYIQTVNEVSPDGAGNLELIEGEHITITEFPDSNQIMIEAEAHPHPNRVTLGNSVEHGGLVIQNRDGIPLIQAEADPEIGEGMLIMTGHTGSNALTVMATGDGLYNGISALTSSGEAGAVGIVGGAMETAARNYGIQGLTMSTVDSSAGVFGKVAQGANYGVWGLTSSPGEGAIGVFGQATAPNTNYGVMGETNSTSSNAAGVLGIAKATDGASATGVAGYAMGSENGVAGITGYGGGSGKNYGVMGATMSSADSSAGVIGINNFMGGGLTFGVYGMTFSGANNGCAVLGRALISGETKVHGVKGETWASGALAAGVCGQALGESGKTCGVYGFTHSHDSLAAGVYGEAGEAAPNLYGVYGSTAGTNDAAGVYGRSLNAYSYGVLGKSFAMSRNTAGVRGIANGDRYYPAKIYGVHGSTTMEADSSAGIWGEAKGATKKVYGVYGTSASSDSGAAGVMGRISSPGKVYGVIGETNSFYDGAAGVFGKATRPYYTAYGVVGYTASELTGGAGVLGKTGNPDSYGVLSYGSLGVKDHTGTNFTMNVYPDAYRIDMYYSGSIITSFGGYEQRVAIQKVNNTAKPTIPDNNFTIAAEAPIMVTNSTHGVTISCPECCTDPCDEGCNCASTLRVGTGGGHGEIKVLTDTGSDGARVYYETGENKTVVEAGGNGTIGKLHLKDAEGNTKVAMCSSSANFFQFLKAWADLVVNGSLTVGGTKSFQVHHPEQEDKDIRFYCAESDEVMIEHRGTLELTDGYGETQLPREFALMSEPGTYSVMCTPQTTVDPGRIAAFITDEGVVQVRSFDGPESMKVAYVIYATRKGYKDHPVVVPRSEDMSMNVVE